MSLSSANAQDASFPGIQLDTITVVATKVEESVEDALVSASAVDQQRLQELQASAPSEVFFGMPGVNATQDGNPAATSINIRGLQDSGRVAVIVDGARRNFQINGHRNANPIWLEPEMLKSVTVVRGPVSNIYGSGAIGGVVAFETKSADDFLLPGEVAAGSVKQGYESNGNGFVTSATGAVRPNDSLGVIGNLVYRERDDYEAGDGTTVPGTGFDVIGGMVKGTAKINENSQFELGWIGDRDDWSETGTSNTLDNELHQDSFSAKYTYNNPDDPWVDLHVGAYSVNTTLFQKRLQDEDVYVGSFFIPPFGPSVPITETAAAGTMLTYDILTTGYDIYNTSRFDTGAWRHTLTYGTDRFLDDVHTKDTAGLSDVFNPSGEREAYGAFVQDKIEYRDWLELIGALRYDGYELDASNVLFANGARGNVNNDSEHLSPRFTVGVSPFENSRLHGFQVYGTFAEGYRAPTTGETLVAGIHPVPVVPFTFLPNAELDPEVAQTWEAGFKFNRDELLRSGDALRIRGAWYNNSVDDYIETVGVSAAATPACPALPANPVVPIVAGTPDCFQYQNISKAEIEGLEFEALYDTGRYFAGISGSRIRGDNLQDKQPLATIPGDQLTLRGGFRMLNYTMTAGGEVQFVADQHRVPEDVDPTDSYTLLNFFASYQPNETFRFDVRLNNILDEAYRDHLSPSLGTVLEEGFNAKVAATIRFGASGGADSVQ